MKSILIIWSSFLALSLGYIGSITSGKSQRIEDVSFYYDTGGVQKIETVTTQEFKSAKSLKTILPDSDIVWLRLTPDNQFRTWGEQLVLFSGSSEMVNSMQAFLLEDDRVTDLGLCDVKLASENCALANAQYSFPLTNLKQTVNPVIYLRVDMGGAAIQNDFHFMPRANYNRVNTLLNFYIGLSTGISLLFACISLVLFSLNQNHSLLLYAGYCFTMFLNTFIYRGIWDAMASPILPRGSVIFPYFLLVPIVLNLLFIKSYFKVTSVNRALNATLGVVTVLVTLITVFQKFFLSNSTIWQASPFTLMGLPLSILLFLSYFVYKGKPTARPFIIAWLPELLSYSLVAAYRTDLLVGHWIIGYIPLFFRPLHLFLVNFLIFINIRKISSEVEYARAREQQGNVVRTLLRTLSHDLSNTTGIIQLNNELAIAENTNPGLVKYLERTQRAAKTQSAMIRHAKKTYLKRGSESALTLSPTSLSNCIAEALDSLENKISSKGIKIVNEIGNQEFAVMAEPVSLTHQVLVNLLDNAIKFTESGKKIHIYCYFKSETQVNLHIADQGIGLPEQLKAQIFDDSPVISRLGTNQEEGTGLGLLVVRDFVATYGGKISVESQENLGTEFLIQFVRYKAPPPN